MHRSRNASKAKAQPRYLDFSDEKEWRRAVRGHRTAAVISEGDPNADQVLYTVPERAKIVRIGKAGAMLGYRLGPYRAGSERREFQFRLFRATELVRLAQWRLKAGIALKDDVWARAIASVAEPNVAANCLLNLCPALSPAEISAAIDEATRKGIRFTAQQLGNLIGLTVEEREGLDIRSIRPAGMTSREFSQYARQRAREHGRKRDEDRRRAMGMKPRRRGESAVEEATREGISVATVYRRRRARSNAAPCEAKTRDEITQEGYCAHSPINTRVGASNWLLRVFATGTRIPINDPDLPPHVSRLGALVAQHAAVHRLARQFPRAA